MDNKNCIYEDFEIERYLNLDMPGRLKFEGADHYKLFTQEVIQSLEGVLIHNYDYTAEHAGFVSVSIDDRPHTGTMWTRDVGVFLRELAHWGYFGRGCLTAKRLIALCERNLEGYYAFPRKFFKGMPDSGSEIDGTAAVLIGMKLLYDRLLVLKDDFGLAAKTASEIYEFIMGQGSPLRFIQHEAGKTATGLIPGSGEFGGGMGKEAEGLWYNPVQNALAAGALYIWGDKDGAEKIIGGIRKHLVNANGFTWCIDTETLQTVDAVLNNKENKGFAGINGIWAMVCDTGASELFGAWGRDAALATYGNLLASPGRLEQYKKYGIYIQFEVFIEGLLTSPSYGQGYAIQTALQLERFEEAECMIKYLAEATKNPPEGYVLTRPTPYWFAERLFSPDYFKLPKERQTSDEGCGALNLVCAAEPLKVARMIAGLGAPQLPESGGVSEIGAALQCDSLLKLFSKAVELPGLDSLTYCNWPVYTGDKIVVVNYTVNQS